MKRFVALLTLVTLMVITAGAARTPAQTYYGYDVDADYGGPLLDESLWEVNFFLDDQLMFSTVSEESSLNYVQDVIGEMMEERGGYWLKAECFYDDLRINVYYERY